VAVYIHKVAYYETDRMGITHHSNYIRWMEEARCALLEEIGWGYDRMEAEGVVSPVVSVSCDYKNTTTFGDEIAVACRIREFRGVRMVVAYEMRNVRTGQLVVTGTSSHCFLSPGGTPAALRRLFPELDAKLRELAAQGE
jgi:acyl-CoA thioester hydrolase